MSPVRAVAEGAVDATPCGGADATVIVCAFSDKRWHLLAAAVESLRAQTCLPAQVVLVIDHNPALLEHARAAWPDLDVVPNGGVRGLAAARNTGVEHARGEIVAFLDDDAVADPDWLERLLRGYGDPAVAAVGGLVEPRWESARPSWLAADYDWVVGCSHADMPARAEGVRNLIGANMSFRRSALALTGGFLHDLGRVGDRPFGCEETELCIRLQQRLPGSVVLYDPAARVRHFVPRERARWEYFVRRCYAEGRSKAAVSRLVGAAALATEGSYLLRVLPRALGDAVRRSDGRGFLRLAAAFAGAAAAAAGYAHGLAEGVNAARSRR